MVDEKFNFIPFVTEVMTARNPSLSVPDTESDFADGKYKTEAVADGKYAEAFQRTIQDIANRHFGGEKRANVFLPWKEATNGEIVFIFKSPKAKPNLVDAKGNSINRGVIIRGGSLIRIVGVIAAWKKGSKAGVSLWPDAVRVIRLAIHFDAAALFGPPEEGYDSTDHGSQ